MLNTLKDALSKFEDNDKLTLNPLKNLKRIIDDGWVYFSATAILMLIDPVNIKFAEDGFSMFHLNLFTSLMIILAVAVFVTEMLSVILRKSKDQRPLKWVTILLEYVTFKSSACLTGLVAIVAGLGFSVNYGGGFTSQYSPISYLLYPFLILTMMGAVKYFATKEDHEIKKGNAIMAAIFVIAATYASVHFKVFGLFTLSSV